MKISFQTFLISLMLNFYYMAERGYPFCTKNRPDIYIWQTRKCFLRIFNALFSSFAKGFGWFLVKAPYFFKFQNCSKSKEVLIKLKFSLWPFPPIRTHPNNVLTANGWLDSPDLKSRCKMRCWKFVLTRGETALGFNGVILSL